MKPFLLRDAVRAVGGQYRGDEAALGREISFVTSDSRTAGPGALFIAYVGARVDGHSFMKSCLSLGATAFLQQLSLLTHTTTTSLVMYGSGSFAISTHNPSVIEVSMRRYSCKVSVESLEVKWLDAFSTPPAVTLERIVLVNVVGSTPYSAVPAVGETWYNRQGVDGSLPAIVKDVTEAEYGSLPVLSSSAVNTLVPLYCMPNPTSNNVNSLNAPSWSPRNTRVALELKVDGVSNWYPVDLPAMLCNRHYLIRRMEVMGPGSQGPDYPVERDDVVFTLEVLPWGDEEIEVSFTD